jgi:23S rRNA pseudouridine2457 synthase
VSKFTPANNRRYIAINKPYAVLSQFTREPNSDKRTLADFGLPESVYPIGRLDFDSEGLLILSDDSRVNSRLLDPKHAHRRTYLVQIERIPEHHAMNQLCSGVVLDGRLTAPATARRLETEPPVPERDVPIRFRKNVPTCWIELTLTEGKNRQVRRMTAAVGHPTLRLLRASIGALNLFDLNLSPGQWCELSFAQIERLFS